MTSEVQDRPGPVAALDRGTNSTRLLVVPPAGVVLEREMPITRLGEQADATRRLSSAAWRARPPFSGSTGIDGPLRCEPGPVGRDLRRPRSDNAAEFMSVAEEITGVRPEVLRGVEEGSLSFAGATAHRSSPSVAGPLLVVDIGGGSTELAAGVRAAGRWPRAPGGVALARPRVCPADRTLPTRPPERRGSGRGEACGDAELAARADLPRLAPED